jgi:hypothetical protein
VALSERIYNQDATATPTLPVPLPQVKGVDAPAYGEPAASLTGGGFAGAAAPEPEALAGLALMGLLLGRFLAQGRRTAGQR